MKQQLHPPNAEFVRLLQQVGWNQAEAARRLHLDPGTVSQYVNDKIRPSLTVLGFFKRLVGDVLAGMPAPAGPVPADRPLASWEAELLGNLRALPVEKRRRVARCLAGLLEEMPNETQPTIAGRQADTQPSVVHPVVEQSLSAKPPLPEPLTKMPSSLAGCQELLRREQGKKGRGKARQHGNAPVPK